MQIRIQHGRFKDAAWFPEKDEHVLVGGAGGISSWAAFFLARAGFKPFVVDFDTVDEINLAGQLFKKNDVGKAKVDAVKHIIKEFVGEDINVLKDYVTQNTPYCPFMFSGFDNMLARKDMFKVWKDNIHRYPITPIFVDGRLVAESFQIFCVTPNNIERYEEKLFDDTEIEDAPCTLRQTSHSAAMIATHMVGFFTNHIANIYLRENIREVPFFYEYFIPFNLTETTL